MFIVCNKDLLMNLSGGVARRVMLSLQGRRVVVVAVIVKQIDEQKVLGMGPGVGRTS